MWNVGSACRASAVQTVWATAEGQAACAAQLGGPPALSLALPLPCPQANPGLYSKRVHRFNDDREVLMRTTSNSRDTFSRLRASACDAFHVMHFTWRGKRRRDTQRLCRSCARFASLGLCS
jgi:hypothetical protein